MQLFIYHIILINDDRVNCNTVGCKIQMEEFEKFNEELVILIHDTGVALI